MRVFFTIFKFAMGRGRWLLLGWGLPLFLIGLITAPFYDLVAENEKQLLSILQSLPPQLTAFVGGDDVAKILTPEGFIALRYFAFLPVILGIYASVAGSGMLAADEERGVLDFLLAHPAGRAPVFWGRAAALAVSLAVILCCAWLGLCFGVWRAAQLDFPPGQLALPFLSAYAVTMLFAALALALSMVVPSRAAAAMFTGIFVFAGYIITNLARAIPALEPAAGFSPISYFQGDALRGLDLGPLLGLILAAAILLGLAWLGFRRRDIRVAGDGGWKIPFSSKR
jgi:ABC-2 type transport system permease protein